MSELISLAESNRKIALDRFRILQPHLQQGRALIAVAKEAGVAYSTAQRWVSLYRKFGLSALARKNRSDRGERRAMSPKLLEAIEGLALQKPPFPIATLYRQICRIAQDRGENVPNRSGLLSLI